MPRKKTTTAEKPKKRRRLPQLTPEAVIKRLWEEAQVEATEDGKLKPRCPVQGAAPRIAALKALAEYFGIIKGGGATDEGTLPTLPIVVETEEEPDE